MKLLIILSSILVQGFLFACPMCAGNSENLQDKYVVYILAGFILLAYIPYIIIYRMIKRGNELHRIQKKYEV